MTVPLVADPAPVVGIRLDVPLSAMALTKPKSDHPNRLPFSGVLTQLDKASDKAPEGAKGRRVILRAAAAEKALDSLIHMGVNYVVSQDGHDVKRKVGVITAAAIRDDAIHIDGHLYASDFPDEVGRIQADKDTLGFSWELANVFVANADANPLDITECLFTGAAILRKDKAAYSSTSLAAAAEGDIAMTKEEFETMLAPAMKALTDELASVKADQTKITDAMQASAAVRAKVEPFASKMDEMADQMEGEGVGTDERSGHVKVLRAMSASMRSDAAQGRVPASYYAGMYASADQAKPGATSKLEDDPAFKALRDELAGEKTKVADMQAAARNGSPEPTRKTLPAAITAMLAKGDLTIGDGDEKLAVSKVDAALDAAGLPISERMRAKAALRQAGKLA